MKKASKILALLICMAILLSGCGQKTETKPPQVELPENKDELLTVYLPDTMTLYVNRGTGLEKFYTMHTSYDENGNKIREYCAEPFEDGFVSQKTTYTYDTYNNPTMITKEKAGSPQTVVNISYTYDDRGNVIMRDTKEGNSSLERSECTYDSNGNKTSEYITFYSYDELYAHALIKWTYDINSHILSKEYQSPGFNYVAEIEYGNNGYISSAAIHYEHGERNLQVAQDDKQCMVYIDDVLIEEMSYEDGNCVEFKCYNKDGTMKCRVVGTYDSYGKLTQINTYTSSGELFFRVDWTYTSMNIPAVTAERAITASANSIDLFSCLEEDTNLLKTNFGSLIEFWSTD